jgi:hypothetical protein
VIAFDLFFVVTCVVLYFVLLLCCIFVSAFGIYVLSQHFLKYRHYYHYYFISAFHNVVRIGEITLLRIILLLLYPYCY